MNQSDNLLKMQKKQIKSIAKAIASTIGDTEHSDLYVISSGLVGFTTRNAASVIENYITLEIDEMPGYEVMLEGVEPVYFSSSDKQAHTAESILDTEEVRETFRNQHMFLSMFDLIAHMGNISSKCYRLSENMSNYLEKNREKPITLAMVKLTIDLLNKASYQFQNNISIIRGNLQYANEMALYFEHNKVEILKGEKRHTVPNVEDFFKMRKYLQTRYWNPLNEYFRVYKQQLEGIDIKEYQDYKQKNELLLSFDTFKHILTAMNDAKTITEAGTAAPL